MLLTLNEISEQNKIPKRTLQKWCKEGMQHIPTKPIRVQIEWVETYIEQISLKPTKNTKIANYMQIKPKINRTSIMKVV